MNIKIIVLYAIYLVHNVYMIYRIASIYDYLIKYHLNIIHRYGLK